MIESFFTKDQDWLDKWDLFLQKTERGLYNQLSDWIKAYQVYGFDYTFYIITHDKEIVGGCGLVLAKFSFLKFLIVPCGPVLSNGFENQLDKCILDCIDFAKKNNCCYFQINIPLLKDVTNYYDYCLSNIDKKSIFFQGKEGTKFKYVIPLYGMRNVDLFEKKLDDIISNYSSNHKRNLKKVANYNFQFKFVNSETEIKKAYHCFIQNAKQKGYPLRTYESIKETLKNYIEKDFAKIGVCFFEDKIVGAIYVMKCGNRLIYLNGGVLQEYQNLPVSIFLHHEIIKFSLENKYKCYDISVGGSIGVKRFKEAFGSELYTFENTRYWVLNSFKFSMYIFVEKRLKKHKQKVANILFYIKKIFK